MNDETKGCLKLAILLLGILVRLPLWFAIMFGVLTAANVPTWVWVLFWFHVPVTTISALVEGILQAFVEEK